MRSRTREQLLPLVQAMVTKAIPRYLRLSPCLLEASIQLSARIILMFERFVVA